MPYPKTKYNVENTWLFGLKWSTVGVMASFTLLAGCSFFDIDNNKERPNSVYGERKAPRLNPNAPVTRARPEGASNQVSQAEATPYDQYNSGASLENLPPATSPMPTAAPAPMPPAAPLPTKSVGTLQPVESPEPLIPAPSLASQQAATADQPRRTPQENRDILGVNQALDAASAAAPSYEPPSYEPPMIKDEVVVRSMPLEPLPQEVPPIKATNIAPAYYPPSAEPASPPSQAGQGSLGMLHYGDPSGTEAVSPVPAQAQASQYQPPQYQAPQYNYMPITATAPAPTPVGPVTLNAPEEALATEHYLPQSRYVTRRSMYRRVNAY